MRVLNNPAWWDVFQPLTTVFYTPPLRVLRVLRGKLVRESQN